MARQRPRTLLAAITALLLVLPFSGVAHAATFVVTITGDTNDVSPGDGVCLDKRGNCSLRAAVEEANALAGADTIELLPGAKHVLRRPGAGEDAAATGDLDITEDLTINGNGATVDAEFNDRHLDILSGSVVVDDVTLRNGDVLDDGGAIRNAGTLTVMGSQIVFNYADNDGGGIYNSGGTLTVTDTVINQNEAFEFGGGIETRGGSATITDSLIANNVADFGGGLDIDADIGSVTVEGSVLQDNLAFVAGGGFFNGAGEASGTTLEFTDSLIRRNEADFGGGGLHIGADGLLRLTSSEVNANFAFIDGGGILSAIGEVRVNGGSVVADNIALDDGGGVYVEDGMLTFRNSQLRGNFAADNGGGIGAGGTATTRVIEAKILDNSADNEGGGLWNAPDSALRVDRSTLSGNLAEGDEAHDGGGGIFNAAGRLTILDSQFNANAATTGLGSGGGLMTEGGSVTIERTRFYDNTAPRAGGGIESSGSATVDLFDTRLDSNAAGINGGGLHVTGSGDTTLTGGRVVGNLADEEGGGLWNGTGAMSVTNVRIRHNEARGDAADQGGGGLFNAGGTLEVFDTTVDTNAATGASGSGGGILNDGGSLTVDGSVFSRNSAIRAGGGIESDVGTNTITDTTARDNTTGSSPGNGGFFHATGAAASDLLMVDVQSNSAANEGGGIWCPSDGDTEITGVVTGNIAPEGPNVFFQLPGAGTCTLNGVPVPPGSPGV